MEKIIVPIKGMHCKACEMLVEEKLQELPGVKKVKASNKKNLVEIVSAKPLAMKQLKQAVQEAGYSVGRDDPQALINRDSTELVELGLAAALVALVVVLARALGLMNLSIGSGGNPSSLAVVFLVGLTAGISTCMALVGGLILGLSTRFAEANMDATWQKKFTPHLLFNIGRIASYFMLGGIIGMLGKAFQLTGMMLGVLTIGAAVVMLTLGLQLTNLFPRLTNWSFALPSWLGRKLGVQEKKDREYSNRNAMILGALTFFLPCGFTQSMQLYAMTTGNFLSGGLIMATFALGTAPGLLSVGGLSTAFKGIWAKRFYKFAGVLVVALALFNLNNGFNLTGWSSIFDAGSSTAAAPGDANVKLENGVQVVHMRQSASGYTPNKFTVQKGIPVRWIVTGTDPYSCSSGIIAATLGVRQNLTQGDNVIEFTPQQVGEIRFNCTMGMYPGKFVVVESAAGS